MTRRTSIILAFIAAAAGAAISSSAHALGEPTLLRAVTADNGDGHLDAITLTFSAPMEATAPKPNWFATAPGQPGFLVEGYSIAGATWTGTGAANTSLRLALIPSPIFDTGATPVVRYVPVDGGPKALATGGALGATPAAGVSSFDGAGPVIVGATARDLPPVNLFNAAGDRLNLTFSEPVLVAGAGPLRMNALENAIRFTGVAAEGANGCPLDGTATSNQNFPQQATGDAPISPALPHEAAQTLTIAMSQGNTASVQKFVGVPRGCALAIDASNNHYLLDESGNVARPFNAVPGKTIVGRIAPEAANLVAAETTDGIGSIPDGEADGIRLVFDSPLDDSTLDAFLDKTTVTVNDATVPIEAVDTGIADDAIAQLAVSVPATGDIEVAYEAGSCAHAPSGTTTDGAAARVPYGGDFAACIASFTEDVTDGVGPAVLLARTIDADGDGRIDGVDVGFSEAVADGAPDGWMLGEAEATAFALDAADATRARITVAEVATPDGSLTPELAYASPEGDPTLDAAGNEVPTAAWPTTDGVGPAVVAATAYDLDGDGHIDELHAELSESSRAAGDTEALFGNVEAAALTVDDNTLIARFDGPTGSGSAPFQVAGGVTDLGDTPMTSLPFTDVVEQVAPAGVITVLPSAPIPAGTATVRAVYTEAMTDAPIEVTFDGVAVTPASGEGHTEHGWRLDDPNVWEGSIEIADDACAESTGCPVTFLSNGGTDLTGLEQNAPLVLHTFIDVIAPDAAPITKVSSLGTSTAPTGVVNSAASNLSVTVDVPDGQADGGTAEILIDGASMNLPMIANIPAGAKLARVESAYESAEDFRAALGEEGTHELKVRLCDAATNCVTGPATSFLVDTIGAPVLVDGLDSRTIAAGGTRFPIGWETEPVEEPIHVDLAWSRNSKDWKVIARGLTPEGVMNWGLPKINASSVRVRAISRDAAGNVHQDVSSGKLVIDSKAPKFKSLSIPHQRGVLPAGKKVTLRWLIKDLTLNDASIPVRIQESVNGGRWRLINGGKRSFANDGRESWKVPGGRGTIRVRVIATDAAGHRTTRSSNTLKRR